MSKFMPSSGSSASRSRSSAWRLSASSLRCRASSRMSFCAFPFFFCGGPGTFLAAAVAVALFVASSSSSTGSGAWTAGGVGSSPAAIRRRFAAATDGAMSSTAPPTPRGRWRRSLALRLANAVAPFHRRALRMEESGRQKCHSLGVAAGASSAGSVIASGSSPASKPLNRFILLVFPPLGSRDGGGGGVSSTTCSSSATAPVGGVWSTSIAADCAVTFVGPFWPWTGGSDCAAESSSSSGRLSMAGWTARMASRKSSLVDESLVQAERD